MAYIIWSRNFRISHERYRNFDLNILQDNCLESRVLTFRLMSLPLKILYVFKEQRADCRDPIGGMKLAEE